MKYKSNNIFRFNQDIFHQNLSFQKQLEIAKNGLNKWCPCCNKVGGKDGCGFGKNRSRKDGLNYYCKKCASKRVKTWYTANPTKIKERRQCQKRYRINNLEKFKERSKKHYSANKEKALKDSKKYYWANYEKYKQYRKKYWKENREKFSEQQKIERKENPTKIRARDRKYSRKRLKNPIVRLSRSISVRMRQSLKTGKNGQHWESLVGYTLKQLIKHLEKQFQLGMTWENYGKWHIDHKIPISVFNFTSFEHQDFKKCWALSNLQPMWAKENISKANKLDKSFQPNLCF